MNYKEERRAKRKAKREAMCQYVSEHRRVFIIYMLLRVSVIFIAVAQFFNQNYENLFVNFIGAAVFSVIGYFYVKNRGKGKFARRFIPQVLDEK